MWPVSRKRETSVDWENTWIYYTNIFCYSCRAYFYNHPTYALHDTLFVTYINAYIFRHQDALHYTTRYHTLRMVYVDEIFSDRMESRLMFVCLYISCTYKKQLRTDNSGSLLLSSLIYNIRTLCFISFISSVNFKILITLVRMSGTSIGMLAYRMYLCYNDALRMAPQYRNM